MNLYIQDNGINGIIIVVASDEPEAHEKMEVFKNHSWEIPLNSYEFNDNFAYATYGFIPYTYGVTK